MANAIMLVHDTDGQVIDIYVPLEITAAELLLALHQGLGHAGNVPHAMRSESPITLVAGNRTLAELGLRNGSSLHFISEERFRGIKEMPLPPFPARFDRILELSKDYVRFGYSTDCQVRLPGDGDGVGFELLKTPDGAMVIARNVDVGVDGRCLGKGRRLRVEDGDFISASSATFTYLGGNVLMSSSVEVRGIPYRDLAEQNSHLVYPQMCRTSRYHDTPPTEELPVLDPPAAPEQQPRNILLTILPTLVMAGLVLVTRGASSGGGMMLFSVLSMGVGAASSVLSYFESSKQHEKKMQLRQSTYLSYIEKRSGEISDAREKERQILRDIYITAQEELRNASDFSADLFDRTAPDTDFLDIRLGYGLLPSAQRVTNRRHEAFEQTDALFEQPTMLSRKFQFSENLPAFVRAREANAIGFLGDLHSLQLMMNQTVLDLAARHFPDDLKLYFLCDENFEEQKQAYRMLPHVRGDASHRNIAHDQKSRDALLEELYKTLSQREEGVAADAPWLAVFICAGDDIMRHPVLKFINSASKLHCVFLFWGQFREQIPQGCTQLVRLFTNEAGGVVVNMFDRNSDLRFNYEQISIRDMRAFSERLAPVYTSEVSLSSTLASSLSLFDMLNIPEANAEDVLACWAKADTSRSLAAPLGVITGDQLITLDLHEKAHGPHGLVAGTTGSGKSEVLLSYVLSMAYNYSPDDVNFMIIDFKGGGIITRLEGLPHLTGTITNLNKRDIERSRISIQAESLRRQQMLYDVKANDISEYTKMLHAGKVSKPLPHLIIIVDEFAELKSQQPEFMDDLISTARIGRSLGIHLILATQKPAGVVNDQIWSNSDFKLCLRVQNKEDSNEVLHSPLAAEIREPGRAYLQVGRSGLFQLFQSGYGGIPVPGAEAIGNEYRVDRLTLSGRRECLFERKSPKVSNEESGETQFVALRRAIIDACAQSNLAAPRPICLPPLPDKLPYQSHDTPGDGVVIGIYDNPAMQFMGDAVINFASGNLLIAGGSQIGKTTLLQTMVRAAAEKYTADDLNLYILDFNSGMFRSMERLDIVGSVVSLDQSERVRNFFKLLHTMVELRKARMAEFSANSIQVYRELSGEAMPVIYIMIDNYASFVDLYDEAYGDELETLLRDGTAVGINFCVTVTNNSNISSRRLCYFSNRICLYQSDRSSYSSVLDGCRKELPDLPGRALFPLGKNFLEMQVFLPFGNVSDSELGKAIASFVMAHSGGKKAHAIPEVPSLLTHALLRDMFEEEQNPFLYDFGMGYESVEPVLLDLAHQFELALVGSNEEARLHFLDGLLRHLSDRSLLGAVNIHIIDNFTRPLKAFNGAVNVYDYTLDPTQAPKMVLSAHAIAAKRFEDARESGSEMLTNVPLEVYIFNTQEVIKSISGDTNAMSRFNEMVEQYSNMKLFFIFGDLRNRSVTYSSPALLRHLKEAYHGILFEPLSTGHMYDIDSLSVRANKAILGRDDAYIIEEGSYPRIKLVWQEK